MRDVLTRVLAVVAVTAMLVGAFAVRDRDAGPDDDPTAAPSGPPDRVANGLRLICLDEVSEICQAAAEADGTIEVEVVDGVDGLSTAVASTSAASVVVAVEPLLAMTDDRRTRAGDAATLTARAPTPFSSPVVFVVWEDRAARLVDVCGELTWSCVGRVAGSSWVDLGGDERWGTVRPDHGDPGTTASGLLALGQAVADRSDVDFSLRDLQDDGTRSFLTTLQRARPSRVSAAAPLEALLTQGRAAGDLVAVLEAEATRLLARAGARGDDLEVRYPGPWVEARVVVGGSSADAVRAVQDLLTTAAVRDGAAAAGWRIDGVVPEGAEAAATRPPDPPLPTAGALEALLAAQREVVR